MLAVTDLFLLQQLYSNHGTWAFVASVATSPLALRWLRDSPRTGCARRTTSNICGANKQ